MKQLFRRTSATNKNRMLRMAVACTPLVEGCRDNLAVGGFVFVGVVLGIDIILSSIKDRQKIGKVWKRK